MRVTAADDAASADKTGSLLLSSGARLNARAMRWADQGLKALTDHGLTTVPFDAIEDLCVPGADVMRAVLDDGFYPPLGPDVVLGRLETAGGAVLTCHSEMTLVGVGKARRR